MYPSPQLEKGDLEQRLLKKSTDANSFNNSINNLKEMITCFKDKNQKSKSRLKNYKTLNTILESVNTFVIIGATSTSTNLSITGIGSKILPTSGGTACFLSSGNKVLPRTIMNRLKKRQKTKSKRSKNYQIVRQIRSLQDNLID